MRQHTTGKASERPKGIKRYASATGAKRVAKAVKPYTGAKRIAKAVKHVAAGPVTVSPHPDVAEKIWRRGVERGSGPVRASAVIVGSRPEKGDLGDFSEDDFEVIFDLLGGSQTLGSTIKNDLDAHELLHHGLPRAALNSLVDKLHFIESDEASEALGMSFRTLQRHKNTPAVHLDVQQSGRAWKFAEILAKATRVLGSQDEAEQWLRHPAIGLDQRRPVDLLTTPAGVKLVEDYLGRLEYNVYT